MTVSEVLDDWDDKSLGEWLDSFGECFQPVDCVIISLMESRLVRPPLSCDSGHESTTWPIVCRWPESQSLDAARLHLCKLAWHGPWSVLKWFSSDHAHCSGWFTISACSSHSGQFQEDCQRPLSDEGAMLANTGSQQVWVFRPHLAMSRMVLFELSSVIVTAHRPVIVMTV